ncbi:MAG TPA: YncE family protein [Ktedonobacterales bacterium]|nr:YncE family protein [Ktedonobacterales bacterium]
MSRWLCYVCLLVGLLSLATGGLLAIVSLPTAPTVAQADGGAPNLAYVAGAGANGQNLAIIDIAQRHETGHITLGGSPVGVVLSVDSRFAFVTERAANRLAIVDTRAKQVAATLPLGRAPTALAVDPSQSILYAVETGSNALAIIDTNARRVVATIPVGVKPTGVAVAAANSGIQNTADEEIYVANSGSNNVSVIGANERRVIATIPTPASPLAVSIPTMGGVAYVTTRAGSVLAISLSAHRLLGTIWQTPDDQLGVMDYDAATGQVYVPDATTGQVALLTPAADSGQGAFTPPTEPARLLPFGGGPAAIAITFEGSFGFVAERAVGKVAIFDATTRHILGIASVGGAPTALVTGAYPPPLSSQATVLVDVAVIGAIVVIMVAAILSLARASAQQRRRQAQARAARVAASAAHEQATQKGAPS